MNLFNFRDRFDAVRAEIVRRYYKLKLAGMSGLHLKTGGEKETEIRGKMYEGHKEEITADMYILTEDAIQNTIDHESEEYKKGFRKFGEMYLEYLKECYSYKLNKDAPELLKEAKKEAELKMMQDIEGTYRS